MNEPLVPDTEEVIHAKCACLSPKAKQILVDAIEDYMAKMTSEGKPVEEVTELMHFIIQQTDDCEYHSDEEVYENNEIEKKKDPEM